MINPKQHDFMDDIEHEGNMKETCNHERTNPMETCKLLSICLLTAIEKGSLETFSLRSK